MRMNNYNFIILHNHLSALDDTYIKVNVSATDRPRYKTWKSEVAANVLRVYDTKDEILYFF